MPRYKNISKVQQQFMPPSMLVGWEYERWIQPGEEFTAPPEDEAYFDTCTVGKHACLKKL